MAYNRKNYLKKVLRVQAITIHYRAQGLYFKEIYHKYIEDEFNISKRTYDEYLSINARKQIKQYDISQIEIPFDDIKRHKENPKKGKLIQLNNTA